MPVCACRVSRFWCGTLRFLQSLKVDLRFGVSGLGDRTWDSGFSNVLCLVWRCAGFSVQSGDVGSGLGFGRGCKI